MGQRGVDEDDRPATLVETARTDPAIATWLAQLPDRIDRCRLRFDLTEVGPMYPSGHASWTAPARTVDRASVVLKVQWPHRECTHEALALRTWNGDGAVRLLDEDETEHALLLERLAPGDPLTTADPDVALAVLVDLVERLLVIAPSAVGTLEDEAAGWRQSLAAAWDEHQPYEVRLRDAALSFLDALGGTQPEQVLLHQDLHGGNVLSAGRAPWLAIDPKPLAGERAFAIAPIVRSRELGHSKHAVLARFDRLVEALDLDAERARGWSIAQTLAWSTASDRPWHADMHDVARWLLDHR